MAEGDPAGRVSKGTKVQKRKIKHGATTGTASNEGTNILSHASHLKSAHINDLKKKKRDLFRRINYHHTFTTVLLPALVILYVLEWGIPIFPENNRTLVFSCIYFNITMLAFTSGYHKCFAHNAFRPRFRWLQVYFAVFGASLGLGSVRWWAALHRAHHQFTDDTEKDPYSIKRGFVWAHWGWLIRKPKIVTFYDEFLEQEFPSSAKSRDLVNEIKKIHGESGQDNFEYEEEELSRQHYETEVQTVVLWQERYYSLIFFITTFFIPVVVTTVVCHDTWVHGLLYPGLLRMIMCQQSQLSIESVCHLREIQVTIPSQPFNDKNSSLNCNNPLVSLLTYGQAHQNYHHEFPHDYRANSSYFAFDPTKWFVWTLAQLGLIEELCRTPTDLIMQLRIQQQQEVINRMKSQLNWGTPISKLPVITPSEFKRLALSPKHLDRIYIVIQNIIHDITPFLEQHPGGVPLLKASRGKDATKAFYGGVYGHLTAAVNLLATMRIGVLDLGNDEDVWRRVVREEGLVNVNDSRRENKLLYRSAEAA